VQDSDDIEEDCKALENCLLELEKEIGLGESSVDRNYAREL
jgi:hypothetical protein